MLRLNMEIIIYLKLKNLRLFISGIKWHPNSKIPNLYVSTSFLKSRVYSSEDDVHTGIDGLEGTGGAFVEDGFSWKTIILIEIIGCHACSELGEIGLAVFHEDVLSGRTLIFSWEAIL